MKPTNSGDEGASSVALKRSKRTIGRGSIGTNAAGGQVEGKEIEETKGGCVSITTINTAHQEHLRL
jgi:hypothetical protein